MGSAVITGAGRGLGRAIAEALAHRGLTVHLTDVDAGAAAEAASAIGSAAFASELDVRDAEACREIAAATVDRTGSLDVWVNNAGILLTGIAWEQDDNARRKMLEINAIGTMNGTVAALERMRIAGRGHVINVISLAGIVAAPGEVAYAASKHAAIAFTIGTALDLRRTGVRGIEVSAVCPDGIWTPMLYGHLEDPDAAGSFSGKFLRPEEVAEAVADLLDRPRLVITIPRWRGAVLRFFDLFPSLSVRLVPLLMYDARRRQAKIKRRVEAGEFP